MPYSETSEYEYITGDELEAIHIDYSALNATLYSEALVMAIVSMAERWVNEQCGQSFTGTIPDGVVAATLEMSKYLMNVRLKEDGYNDDFETPFIEVERFCLSALQKKKVDISYSSSLDDFHLPNREG